MRFLVVTNAPTLKEEQGFVAYAPYVREMDIWAKYVEEFVIISPTAYNQNLLTIPFAKRPKVTSIPRLNFTSIKEAFKSFITIPIIIFKLFVEMKKADHIHLRCPGNIGLLGCLVQILFPKKIKTAKYAGNWDPKAKQPISYRIQKKILSNTFWTKNITTLVYGDWKNQTKNIKSFFTATFKNQDRLIPEVRDYSKQLNFVFIGSLVKGKRPFLAIQIVEALQKKGLLVRLDIYGDGMLRDELQVYLSNNKLNETIRLHGNQTNQIIKKALQLSHFIILASQSEGWPKVLAEAMFFGVIPIATAISCVPNMLDQGKRGILIQPNIEDGILAIELYLQSKEQLKIMSKLASDWSQDFTLDVFEDEIKKLILV